MLAVNSKFIYNFISSNQTEMKKLILVRHAKSDWPEDTDDFNRPLADRGLEDAMNMAKFLKEKEVVIEKSDKKI